ncbi:MAG TPA: tetratricopeptide repeat protein [Thermoanaerobaculia bacterium]|jgi:Flp pilus assembly protein TadD|nr:tetratricopeptide repeat protein [Thermoanaerobaculia bacterium]
MRRFPLLIAVIFSVVTAVSVSGQIRGTGRLSGTVTDKTTGKPVEGAVVTISLPAGNTVPIVSKTDARGHWSALGLTTGQWNIDIVAEGYQTARGSASVSELRPGPPMQTGMSPVPKEEAAPQAVAQTPLVPKEAEDAIVEGQNLLKIHAGDTSSDAAGAPHQVTADEARDAAKRAVADFEKALPLVPDDKPETKQIRSQLSQVMAQAYYRAGDLPKAIAMLEVITTADPSNTAQAALLANLYLQNGQLDAGKTLLEKLPPDTIKDSTIYVNVGILFLNKKSPADAVTYFTKAVTMEPKSGDAHYYRALAYAQLKKNAESRADFEQVLVLAPDTPEAKDAKAMLAALPAK